MPKWKEIERFWYENYDRELYSVANQVNINPDGTLMPCYKLINGYKETRRGYYIHPDLVHFIIDRCNIAYAFKVSKIMNLINEELHLRNITLETKIEEMQDEIRYLKTELKNTNKCMKRIEGSIKIDKHYKKSNTYHLFADTKMQYKNSRTVEVIPLYNAYDTLRLMNYYAKYNCTKLVKLINPNIFEADYENLIIFLNQVSDNTLNVTIDYNLLINRILSSKRIRCYYKPQLFEIYCSQQFNIPLFKFALTESVGLYKQDRGCDLFDINKKITGQCKYFINSTLNERYLNKYFEFVDAMSYDDNCLFVNDGIKFAKSLILYDENLEQINCNSTIDKTKDIYIKTTENNYITIKFVNVDKFEEFVTELEDKYDEHVSYEEFMQSLTSFTLKHIQLQRERINSYNNQQVIKEKIDRINERSHENKDEKFECTIFKEQREYLKKLIKENPSGIEVNECIKMVNDKFNTNYDVIRFGQYFSDLYQHKSNSTFPIINGKKMILPDKQINNEFEFIHNYIGIKDILVTDYLKVHNEKFNTHYNVNSFAQTFGKLFKNDGSCFARRTINGERVHVLELINTNRHEKINEIIKDVLTKYKTLPLLVLLTYIQYTYQIYYTSKSFVQEYDNYNITAGERFTNKRTECLKQFIESLDNNKLKEDIDNLNLKAPKFISLHE